MNRALIILSGRRRTPINESKANLTKHFLSRLSRNRHMSLERSLYTINQGVSSLSIQQRLEIVGSPPCPVLGVQPTCAAITIEEWDAVEGGAGHPHSIQSDPSVPDTSWHTQTRVKRTMREEKSVMEYFLGTIRAESNTVLQTSREIDDLTPCYEQKEYEHTTSYTIYPATWLIRLGFHRGLHLGFLSSSTQGWKNILKTFCPVPDDALIFDFSKEGNLPAVRRLLSGGHASVRDTDSQGCTPLHVSPLKKDQGCLIPEQFQHIRGANTCVKFAARNHHPELCKFLKGAGADISALTYNAE